ncbi:hypothetical protein EJ08DRAFT_37181 [Tothia fuscella]|uniref:Uncharacterized protein n=1 Tax=Tothia fuscella TaxID=1048955 RepID=A0A9P4U0K9_9PEZI|nr:hypothetical protein EJ08DRAFT_37181 [Tothia fuscella]
MTITARWKLAAKVDSSSKAVMATRLHFTLREEDPWHVTQEAFSIITTYVQADDQASPAETAMKLDKLSPRKRKMESGEKMEQDHGFLLEFWHLVVGIAKQIPSDHADQDQLVKLIAALSELFSEGNAATCHCHEGKHVSIWTHSDGLDDALRYSWSEPSDHEQDFGIFEPWISFNAFVSRMFGTTQAES